MQVFKRGHRTAHIGTVLLFLTVFDSDERFRILRGDAEDPADPRPEDCAGAADRDGRTDADDVSGADR